jgi:hypothetical protein
MKEVTKESAVAESRVIFEDRLTSSCNRNFIAQLVAMKATHCSLFTYSFIKNYICLSKFQ